MKELKQKVKDARIQYAIHKLQAHEYGRTFLGKLAQDYADRDDNQKDAAHNLQVLKHHEDERQAFQRIHFSLKPSLSGLSRVEIENEDGTRTLVCNKEGIKKEIAQVNVGNYCKQKIHRCDKNHYACILGNKVTSTNGTKLLTVLSGYQITMKPKKEQGYGWNMSAILQ